MKKWVVLLALLGVSGLFLPCEAQQIMYANLRELVIDTALYVNCRKMRYKRYRFGNCYAAAMHVGDKFYFCTSVPSPLVRLPRARPSRPTPRSWAARWAMPLPRRRWWLPACSTKSIPKQAVPSLWARTRC